MRERAIGIGLAAASGVLWALCFARQPSLWLGWVALVPLIAALGRPRVTAKRALLLGLVHGVVSWMISIYWIPSTLHTFGQVPLGLAWILLALVALFLGLFRAAFALLARRLLRGRPITALACLPGVWVVTEWLRGHAVGDLNFPWNLAAYAWVEVPGALPLAAWIGSWGVSFLVVGTNVALALAWRARRPLAGAVAVLSALLLLAFAARFSGRGLAEADRGRPVSLLQPNQTMRTDTAGHRRQYEQLIQQTLSECVSSEPALVIWPESAAWPHTWEGSWLLQRDLGRIVARGCSVVFNTATADRGGESNRSDRSDSSDRSDLSDRSDKSDDAAGRYFNSALIVEAASPEELAAEPGFGATVTGSYHKRFLVPFGEHVPLGELFPFIDKLARLAGRYSRGRDAGLLEWRGERLGVGICYEVVFPGALADQVRAGATLLVNISNDSWYGDRSAVYQLFRAARFRAAENRRMMLRAGLTGISGIIGPRGEVIERLGIGRRGVLRTRIVGHRELTPYARAPWLVPLISAILTIVGFVVTRRTIPGNDVPG